MMPVMRHDDTLPEATAPDRRSTAAVPEAAGQAGQADQAADPASRAGRGTWPAGRRRGLVLVALLAAALNLRPAVTSLGPVLAEVRHGLGMSGTVAGLLTSVPTLCFGLFGAAAPRLARRTGPGAVVFAGMCALTAGIALRSAAGGTVPFLAATALALAGIAVGNVLMPVVVKRWFPDRVGMMTGLYSMGISVGTAAAAAATVPVEHALGGSWRLALLAWAFLAVPAVLLWLPLVRDRTAGDRMAGDRTARVRPAGDRTAPDRTRDPAAATTPDAGPPNTVPPGATAPVAAAPDGATPTAEGAPQPAQSAEPGGGPVIARSRTAWAMAVFFGLQAAGAYITMGWMPQIFRDAGVSADAAGVLLAVTMAVSVPLSFVLPALAGRMRRQGGLAVALGAFGLAGYAGLWLAPAAQPWLWAILLGVANCAFPLALTMIGMRARSSRGVVRLSAFAQCTGYLLSIPGPILVGALYQHTGGWGAPIAVMVALLVPQTAAGVVAGRDRHVEDEV
jgi:CP family cyanate transporter-like MFS transporter